jgi:hypothetical protein
MKQTIGLFLLLTLILVSCSGAPPITSPSSESPNTSVVPGGEPTSSDLAIITTGETANPSPSPAKAQVFLCSSSKLSRESMPSLSGLPPPGAAWNAGGPDH